MDYSQIPSPCYVLDLDLFRKNLALIQSVSRESGAEIILAFKGFAMWSVFPVVREYISGATASSGSEALLAREEMKCEAHAYAAVYTDNDFDTILRNCSHISFNSLAQYSRFLPQVKASDRKVSLGLRVNPEYSEVGTALYNPCAPGSRLGITADLLGDKLPEAIEGLHFHVHCESSSFELERSLARFEEKFGHLLRQVKWVNMGGGHLMTRKDYDTAHLIALIKAFKQKYGVHVILEPGSAFAWETGVLVSTVEDIVENAGIRTAMLNVSFTAHMPDCLEMPYKPRVIGATDEVPGKPTYRLGGNSCLSGDFMGNWSFEQPLEVGQRLIFEDMIHYTMVKTTTFNGVHHPSIGTWSREEGFRLIRSFGYADYKNRLS